ncbi:DinB family protein [Tunturibacter empetritectus]|uniref:DinB family protein n=1 Tax=Tunturiibacter empetritectus TaxID=3069691 RepID=A0AAU7ZAB4_9BACT
MNPEASLIDSALRSWKANVDRTTKLFSALTEEQLLEQVAPGKNRLIYLWGHLAASSDALLPLLGLGQRLHPELDFIFIANPDGHSQNLPSGADLKRIWNEVNDALWTAFSNLSGSDWAQRHTAISQEDFKLEPHRNRFTILLSRTAHLAYHFGQAKLAPQR